MARQATLTELRERLRAKSVQNDIYREKYPAEEEPLWVYPEGECTIFKNTIDLNELTIDDIELVDLKYVPSKYRSPHWYALVDEDGFSSVLVTNLKKTYVKDPYCNEYVYSGYLVSTTRNIGNGTYFQWIEHRESMLYLIKLSDKQITDFGIDLTFPIPPRPKNPNKFIYFGCANPVELNYDTDDGI